MDFIIKEADNVAVLPLITAAFAAGIVVASTAAVPAVVQLVITPAAFAASWILYLLKKKKPALVLLLFLFCCLGTAAASLAFRQLQAPCSLFWKRKVTLQVIYLPCCRKTAKFLALFFTLPK